MRVMIGARSPVVFRFNDGTILLQGIRGQNYVKALHDGKWQDLICEVDHISKCDTSAVLAMIDHPMAYLSGGLWQLRVRYFTDYGATKTADFTTTANLGFDANNGGQYVHGLWYWNNQYYACCYGQHLVPGRGNQYYRTYLIKSATLSDWTYVSTVAEWADYEPLFPQLWADTNMGIYGAVEPDMLHVSGAHLICVMRTTNDESNIGTDKFDGPYDDYSDLQIDIRGDGIHSSVAQLSPLKYYKTGALTNRFLIRHSYDMGQTWGPLQVHQFARGCFPRLAKSGNQIALSYGGLYAPRWGNDVCISQDGGNSWNFSSSLSSDWTSGYTSVVPNGSGFDAFFDTMPRQAHLDSDAHTIYQTSF